jgi:hypothetical protein
MFIPYDNSQYFSWKLSIIQRIIRTASKRILSFYPGSIFSPSILVYNDAVFTESDFKSLASIGQGNNYNLFKTNKLYFKTS